MTNLKKVNEGFNKFCGPAVLSILTGKNTDDCAWEISKVSGHYNVVGVQLTDLLKAADRLGFLSHAEVPQGSLYRTLITLINNEGMYIVTVPRHFVCIEIRDREIYFCDNHTKEPIPAASSARLRQRVEAIHKVWPKPDYLEVESPKLKLSCVHDGWIAYCNNCDAKQIQLHKWRKLTAEGTEFEVLGTEENLAKLSRFVAERAG